MEKLNSTLLVVVFGVMMAILSGCSVNAPLQFRTEIDALAAPGATIGNRFWVLPGNPGGNEQDLQFIEFKGYIEKVLANRGFVKAATAQDSDLVVFLGYGVGQPEVHQYTYDVPMWNDWGYYYPYRRSFYYRGFYPGFAGAGYTQRIDTYTTFRRYLTLEACETGPYLTQQQRKQLWKTSVQSSGASNDLRLVFPYMAAAMQSYIGANTGHMVTVDIDETDPLARSLLGPLPTTPLPPR